MTGLTQTKLIIKIAPLSSTSVHLEFDGNLFDPIILNLGQDLKLIGSSLEINIYMENSFDSMFLFRI